MSNTQKDNITNDILPENGGDPVAPAEDVKTLDDLYSSYGMTRRESSDLLKSNIAASQRYRDVDITLDKDRGKYNIGRNIDLNYAHAIGRVQDNEWGRSLIKIPRNFVGGFIEGVGYLPELFDSSGDFDNAVVGFGKWIKDSGFITKAYRTDDNTFSFNDAAWWSNNVAGLIESVAAFASIGGAYSKALGWAGQAVGKIGNIGKIAKVSKFGKVVKDASVSLALAYTEGAMTGHDVFKEIRQREIDRGLSVASAEKIAGVGSKSAVMVNTVTNTALNYIGISAITGVLGQSAGRTIGGLTRKNAGQVDEALKNIGNRIKKNFNKDSFTKIIEDVGKINYARNKRDLLGDMSGMIKEQLGESVEELVNVAAEQIGLRTGTEENKDLGFFSNLFVSMKGLSNFFDDVGTDEGLLSGTLGFIGGIGQGAVMNNVMMVKNTNPKIDEFGNIVYQKASEEAIKSDEIPTVKVGDKHYLADENGKPMPEIDESANTFSYTKKGWFGGKAGEQVNLISAKRARRLSKEREVKILVGSIKQDLTTMRDSVKVIEEKSKIEPSKLTEKDKKELNEAKANITRLNNYRSVNSGYGGYMENLYNSLSDIDNEKDIAKEMVEYNSAIDEKKKNNEELTEDEEAKYAYNEAKIKEFSTKFNFDPSASATNSDGSENKNYVVVTEAMDKNLATSKDDNMTLKLFKHNANKLKTLNKLYEDHDISRPGEGGSVKDAAMYRELFGAIEMFMDNRFFSKEYEAELNEKFDKLDNAADGSKPMQDIFNKIQQQLLEKGTTGALTREELDFGLTIDDLVNLTPEDVKKAYKKLIAIMGAINLIDSQISQLNAKLKNTQDDTIKKSIEKQIAKLENTKQDLESKGQQLLLSFGNFGLSNIETLSFEEAKNLVIEQLSNLVDNPFEIQDLLLTGGHMELNLRKANEGKKILDKYNSLQLYRLDDEKILKEWEELEKFLEERINNLTEDGAYFLHLAEQFFKGLKSASFLSQFDPAEEDVYIVEDNELDSLLELLKETDEYKNKLEVLNKILLREVKKGNFTETEMMQEIENFQREYFLKQALEEYGFDLKNIMTRSQYNKKFNPDGNSEHVVDQDTYDQYQDKRFEIINEVFNEFTNVDNLKKIIIEKLIDINSEYEFDYLNNLSEAELFELAENNNLKAHIKIIKNIQEVDAKTEEASEKLLANPKGRSLFNVLQELQQNNPNYDSRDILSYLEDKPFDELSDDEIEKAFTKVFEKIIFDYNTYLENNLNEYIAQFKESENTLSEADKKTIQEKIDNERKYITDTISSLEKELNELASSSKKEIENINTLIENYKDLSKLKNSASYISEKGDVINLFLLSEVDKRFYKYTKEQALERIKNGEKAKDVLKNNPPVHFKMIRVAKEGEDAVSTESIDAYNLEEANKLFETNLEDAKSILDNVEDSTEEESGINAEIITNRLKALGGNSGAKVNINGFIGTLLFNEESLKEGITSVIEVRTDDAIMYISISDIYSFKVLETDPNDRNFKVELDSDNGTVTITTNSSPRTKYKYILDDQGYVKELVSTTDPNDVITNANLIKYVQGLRAKEMLIPIDEINKDEVNDLIDEAFPELDGNVIWLDSFTAFQEKEGSITVREVEISLNKFFENKHLKHEDRHNLLKYFKYVLDNVNNKLSDENYQYDKNIFEANMELINDLMYQFNKIYNSDVNFKYIKNGKELILELFDSLDSVNKRLKTTNDLINERNGTKNISNAAKRQQGSQLSTSANETNDATSKRAPTYTQGFKREEKSKIKYYIRDSIINRENKRLKRKQDYLKTKFNETVRKINKEAIIKKEKLNEFYETRIANKEKNFEKYNNQLERETTILLDLEERLSMTTDPDTIVDLNNQIANINKGIKNINKNIKTLQDQINKLSDKYKNSLNQIKKASRKKLKKAEEENESKLKEINLIKENILNRIKDKPIFNTKETKKLSGDLRKYDKANRDNTNKINSIINNVILRSNKNNSPNIKFVDAKNNLKTIKDALESMINDDSLNLKDNPIILALVDKINKMNTLFTLLQELNTDILFAKSINNVNIINTDGSFSSGNDILNSLNTIAEALFNQTLRLKTVEEVKLVDKDIDYSLRTKHEKNTTLLIEKRINKLLGMTGIDLNKIPYFEFEGSSTNLLFGGSDQISIDNLIESTKYLKESVDIVKKEYDKKTKESKKLQKSITDFKDYYTKSISILNNAKYTYVRRTDDKDAKQLIKNEFSATVNQLNNLKNNFNKALASTKDPVKLQNILDAYKKETEAAINKLNNNIKDILKTSESSRSRINQLEKERRTTLEKRGLSYVKESIKPLINKYDEIKSQLPDVETFDDYVDLRIKELEEQDERSRNDDKEYKLLTDYVKYKNFNKKINNKYKKQVDKKIISAKLAKESLEKNDYLTPELEKHFNELIKKEDVEVNVTDDSVQTVDSTDVDVDGTTDNTLFNQDKQENKDVDDDTTEDTIDPTVEVDEDINNEEAKAEIERKRQEELKEYANKQANKAVKYNENGDSVQLTEKDKKTAEIIIKSGIKRGWSAQEIINFLESQGIIRDVSLDAKTFRNYIENRISGKTSTPINGNLLADTNAKYDAQLTALDQQPTGQKDTSDKNKKEKQVKPVEPTADPDTDPTVDVNEDINDDEAEIEKRKKEELKAFDKTIEPEYNEGDYNKVLNLAFKHINQGKKGVTAPDMTNPENLQLLNNYPKLFEETIKALDAKQKTLDAFDNEKVLAGKENLVPIYEIEAVLNKSTGKLDIKWVAKSFEDSRNKNVLELSDYTFNQLINYKNKIIAKYDAALENKKEDSKKDNTGTVSEITLSDFIKSIDTKKSPTAKSVINAVSSLIGLTEEVKVFVNSDKGTYYDPINNEIHIAEDADVEQKVHELIHYLTIKAINDVYKETKNNNENAKEIFRYSMGVIYDYFKNSNEESNELFKILNTKNADGEYEYDYMEGLTYEKLLEIFKNLANGEAELNSENEKLSFNILSEMLAYNANKSISDSYSNVESKRDIVSAIKNIFSTIFKFLFENKNPKASNVKQHVDLLTDVFISIKSGKDSIFKIEKNDTSLNTFFKSIKNKQNGESNVINAITEAKSAVDTLIKSLGEGKSEFDKNNHILLFSNFYKQNKTEFDKKVKELGENIGTNEVLKIILNHVESSQLKAIDNLRAKENNELADALVEVTVYIDKVNNDVNPNYKNILVNLSSNISKPLTDLYTDINNSRLTNNTANDSDLQNIISKLDYISFKLNNDENYELPEDFIEVYTKFKDSNFKSDEYLDLNRSFKIVIDAYTKKYELKNNETYKQYLNRISKLTKKYNTINQKMGIKKEILLTSMEVFEKLNKGNDIVGKLVSIKYDRNLAGNLEKNFNFVYRVVSYNKETDEYELSNIENDKNSKTISVKANEIDDFKSKFSRKNNINIYSGVNSEKKILYDSGENNILFVDIEPSTLTVRKSKNINKELDNIKKDFESIKFADNNKITPDKKRDLVVKKLIELKENDNLNVEFIVNYNNTNAIIRQRKMFKDYINKNNDSVLTIDMNNLENSFFQLTKEQKDYLLSNEDSEIIIDGRKLEPDAMMSVEIKNKNNETITINNLFKIENPSSYYALKYNKNLGVFELKRTTPATLLKEYENAGDNIAEQNKILKRFSDLYSVKSSLAKDKSELELKIYEASSYLDSELADGIKNEEKRNETIETLEIIGENYKQKEAVIEEVRNLKTKRKSIKLSSLKSAKDVIISSGNLDKDSNFNNKLTSEVFDVISEVNAKNAGINPDPNKSYVIFKRGDIINPINTPLQSQNVSAMNENALHIGVVNSKGIINYETVQLSPITTDQMKSSLQDIFKNAKINGVTFKEALEKYKNEEKIEKENAVKTLNKFMYSFYNTTTLNVNGEDKIVAGNIILKKVTDALKNKLESSLKEGEKMPNLQAKLELVFFNKELRFVLNIKKGDEEIKYYLDDNTNKFKISVEKLLKDAFEGNRISKDARVKASSVEEYMMGVFRVLHNALSKNENLDNLKFKIKTKTNLKDLSANDVFGEEALKQELSDFGYLFSTSNKQNSDFTKQFRTSIPKKINEADLTPEFFIDRVETKLNVTDKNSLFVNKKLYLDTNPVEETQNESSDTVDETPKPPFTNTDLKPKNTITDDAVNLLKKQIEILENIDEDSNISETEESFFDALMNLNMTFNDLKNNININEYSDFIIKYINEDKNLMEVINKQNELVINQIKENIKEIKNYLSCK